MKLTFSLTILAVASIFSSMSARALSLYAACGAHDDEAVVFQDTSNSTIASCGIAGEAEFFTLPYNYAVKSRVDAARGTLHMYTGTSGTNSFINYSVQSITSVSENIVINEAWTGGLELELTLTGETGPKFFFNNSLDPIESNNQPAPSAEYTVHMEISATGFNFSDTRYYEYITDQWLLRGSESGNMSGGASGSSHLTGAFSLKTILPDSLVGETINLLWSTELRQASEGYIDGYGTGDIDLALPSGFSYTPDSATFLSQKASGIGGVPSPGALVLVVLGLVAMGLSHRKSRRNLSQ